MKTAGWAKAALTKGETYSFWLYSTLWAVLEGLLPPPLSCIHAAASTACDAEYLQLWQQNSVKRCCAPI